MPENTLINGDYRQFEAQASEAITPGHLVEFGGSNDIQKHSSAPDLNGNGSTAKYFAREIEEVGRGIDDDYASGDAMKVMRPATGSKVYAFLSAGETVSKGDPLESDGAGALQAHTGLDTTGDGTGGAAETVADDLVASYAAEAVDNSAGTDPVRIEVRVA